MNILLFSFFNSNNIGDRLIAETFSQLLSEIGEVTPCSYEGSFQIQNCFKQEILPLSSRIIRKISRVLHLNYDTPKQKEFYQKLSSVLMSTDVVVFGGGNIMADYISRSYSYEKYAEYVKRICKENISCAALSVGIGPFATDKQQKKAIGVLNNCDYVSFRDTASYTLYKNAGGNAKRCAISMDPVFLYKNQCPLPVDKDRKCIALNIIYPTWMSAEIRDKIMDGYCGMIRAVLSTMPACSIILFCTEKSDMQGAMYVVDRLGDESRVQFVSVPDIEKLTEVYSHCSAVIGARMHSLIIAYTQNKPVIGLSWQTKVNSFFDIIGEPDSVYNIAELDNKAEIIAKLLSQKIKGTPDNQAVIKAAKQAIYKDIDVIRRISEKNE